MEENDVIRAESPLSEAWGVWQQAEFKKKMILSPRENGLRWRSRTT